MVQAGCVFVAGIRLSRTWRSGSFESMRWNAWVHRLDLGLYSHPWEKSLLPEKYMLTTITMYCRQTHRPPSQHQSTVFHNHLSLSRHRRGHQWITEIMETMETCTTPRSTSQPHRYSGGPSLLVCVHSHVGVGQHTYSSLKHASNQ